MGDEIEVEERSPLEEMICDALKAAFREWLEEEGIAEQLCDSVRGGAIEVLEGVVIPHLGKASKN